MDKRPQGRDKYVTNNGKGVHRRGEGLNTGPVGGQQARPGFGQGPRGGGGGNKGRPTRSGGGGLLGIIAAAVLLLGGGGLFGSGVLGGESAEPVYTQQPSSGYSNSYTTPSSGGTSSYNDYSSALESIFGSASTGSDPYASLFGGGTSSGGGSTSSSSSAGSSYVNTNTGAVDNDVAAGSRAKRTVIKGKGKDTVTVMVYMCGTDLESRSAMGTKDIIEMTKARLSDNVNVIIYTGGCARWNNQVMSNKVNQIYKVENGQLNRLVSDAGNVSMTSPATLTSFIQWCDKNYPANRNELILWDHGGGSVSGYGYDEKYQRSGSMTLAGINTALSDAGVSFDFIGFDACLMATVETGLMLDQYADYMIASEETEPGIGWYYTNWLTKLSADTSMQTTEIGKNIVDDFVSTCQSQTRGQSATLSVVDLAGPDRPGALRQKPRHRGGRGAGRGPAGRRQIQPHELRHVELLRPVHLLPVPQGQQRGLGHQDLQRHRPRRQLRPVHPRLCEPGGQRTGGHRRHQQPLRLYLRQPLRLRFGLRLQLGLGLRIRLRLQLVLLRL